MSRPWPQPSKGTILRVKSKGFIKSIAHQILNNVAPVLRPSTLALSHHAADKLNHLLFCQNTEFAPLSVSLPPDVLRSGLKCHFRLVNILDNTWVARWWETELCCRSPNKERKNWKPLTCRYIGRVWWLREIMWERRQGARLDNSPQLSDLEEEPVQWSKEGRSN